MAVAGAGPRKRRGGAPAVEIAHGATVAELGEAVWNWSSPAGQARLRRRIALFANALGLAAGPKRVLELGCGTGLYTEQMAPRCAELVATDIAEVLLAQARTRVPARHVRFVAQNLEAVRAADLGPPFDGVYGCSVLHHLDLDVTLPQLRPLLAPGAALAFSEPNLWNPQVRLMFSRWQWARRRWATSDTEMAFYAGELERSFEDHGFEVVALFPFDFMHPAIPAGAVAAAERLERFVERVPVMRYLAGSYFVHARVPR